MSDYCAIAAISAISLLTSTSACRTFWSVPDAEFFLRAPSALTVPAQTSWEPALPCRRDNAPSEADRFMESRTRSTRKSSCDLRRVMARRTGAMVGRIGATCSCDCELWRSLSSTVHDGCAGWCRRLLAPLLQEARISAIRTAFVFANLLRGGCSSCTPARGELKTGIDRLVAVSSCAGTHVLQNDNACNLGTSEAAAVGGLRTRGVLGAVLREHPLRDCAIARGVQVDRDDSPCTVTELWCLAISPRRCCNTIPSLASPTGDSSKPLPTSTKDECTD